MRAKTAAGSLLIGVFLAFAGLPRPALGQTPLVVVSPSGGESWTVGSQQQIQWTGPAGGNARIEVSRDGGTSFDLLFSNTPNDGSQVWEVDGPVTTQARIRITLLDDPTVSGESAADFAVAAAFTPPTVIAPSGGESWPIGTFQSIQWSDAAGGNVRIELSRDGGASFDEVLFSNIPNDGEQVWQVSGPISLQAVVRVTLLADPTVTAVSAAPFTIASVETPLSITSPTGGESWPVASTRSITWEGAPGGNVRIELSRDGGATFTNLFENTPNDGTQSWEVSGPPSASCRVRITRLDDPTTVAVSAANFAITGVTVTKPNGDEVWVLDSQQLITWNSAGVGSVRIELSRDDGASYETLFSNTPDDGSQLWTVEGPIAADCRVRVTRLDDAASTDVSNLSFVITDTLGLTVTAPNGGEILAVGSDLVITWSGLRGGRVRIELSRDGGATWEVLFTNALNIGSKIWTVTGPDTREALVRVTRETAPMVSDASDQAFTISTDALTVAAPRPGDDWVIGTQHAILWASIRAGEVRIELSRDGGVTFEPLFDRTLNDGTQFWLVTGPPTTTAVVRVTGLDGVPGADVSDGLFTISRGTLALTQPNGGERWGTGSQQLITWATTTGGNVAIELSRDGGLTWETLFGNTPNDGSEPWTVTGPASDACVVSVTSLQDPALTDESNDEFQIFCAPATSGIAAGQEVAGVLTSGDCVVGFPPGAQGRLHTFFMPAAGLVTIDVRSAVFDARAALVGPDGGLIAENDNFGATTDARIDSVELPAGGPYTIVVTAVGGGVGAYTVSLSRFDIELLAPTGGEIWRFGERRLISWRSGAPQVGVDLTLFRSGNTSGVGEVIAVGATNDGVEPWTVSPPFAPTAVLQACIPYGSRGTRICDVSQPFTLEPCGAADARPCFDGPAGAVSVGQCRTGVQRCGADGIFGACEGAVLPQPEVCGDQIDQDCDGRDAICQPCPVTGGCADDDPCTSDTCTGGVCQHERPAAPALLTCRTGALRLAIGSLSGLCPAPARVGPRSRRSLERLVAAVERAVERARGASSKPGCVRALTVARARAMRLHRRLERAASRGKVCDAARVLLSRRISDVAAAIVAVSSCEPRP